MTSAPNEPGQSGSEKKPAEEPEASAAEQSESSTAAGHGDAETGAEKSGAEQTGAGQDESGTKQAGTEQAEAGQTEKVQPVAETPETAEASGTAEESGADATSESAAPAGASEPGESSEAAASSEAGEQPAKKKSKVGMIIAVAASVLVLAAVAVGAYLFFSAGTAQSAADDYAALSSKETQDPRSVSADDYREVVCTKAMPQIEELQKQKEEFLKVAKPQDFEQLKQVKTSVKSVQEQGETGTVQMESSGPGAPPQTAQLQLVKEDGKWKVCA